MSELTKCNHCSLQDMELRASLRGATVIVIHETSGEMQGWYSARYSDEPEPSRWFKQLPVGCCC